MKFRGEINPTVPPCLQECGGRREQRGWTGARARGGPLGPDISPSRREAARREQAQRDYLPLVSRDNGRASDPLIVDSSGVVQPLHLRRTLPPSVSLSVRRFCGFFSVNANLTTGSVSPRQGNVKFRKEKRISFSKRFSARIIEKVETDTGGSYGTGHQIICTVDSRRGI